MSLLSLVEKNQTGKALTRQYATAIGKEDDWHSDVTYDGFTNFGLSYLQELGFLDNSLVPQLSITARKTGAPQVRANRTFLFTWNPSKWKWDDLPQAVYDANAEGRYLDKWSCGVTRNILPGDRAFLMRLGVPPKGIMGSGVIVSDPFEDLHWDSKRAERGDKVYRVEILFDVLSDSPIISEETLTSGVLEDHDWFPQASGTHIPSKVAGLLEALWTLTTGTVFDPPEPEQIPRIRIEGTKRSRLVSIFERNPEAREECLRYHGTTCHVCGFVFEIHYGSIGKGFIHVHHVVPVSEIRQEYKVDPVNDLAPVCPNCHAMLHKRTPPHTIAELKAIMKALG
jgi:5-methylcytosine-specific restriction protein A